MSSTLEPTPAPLSRPLNEKIAAQVAESIASGRPVANITQALIGLGHPANEANDFVARIEGMFREARANAYKRKMRNGILWAIGGTALTVWTYTAASQGGFYFVAWGAIAYGIMDFLRGLFGWAKYRTIGNGSM